MKKRVLFCFWICIAGLMLACNTVQAIEYSVGGKPLTVTGYITQGAAYGVHKDYDTYYGIQQALSNAFVEMQYRPSDNLSLYGSGRFTMDWAYDINSHTTTWDDRMFNKSRSRMYMDNNYWQVLNELHVTWKPENFLFRVGKQILSWGEMDGFRIMDQINPLDSRRGFADVEFENTLIPIWLVKSEWYPKLNVSWLQDLALEFTFNPNMTFIGDQNPLFGNDDGGIWNPFVRVNDPTVPFGEAYLGSAYYYTNKPANWSSNGFEYAFRAKGVVNDFILTLNYFYGLDNSPVFQFKYNQFDPDRDISVASNGRLLFHFPIYTEFRKLNFAGLTASRDIPFLASSALGGVAPIFRFEGFYAFGTTFETNTVPDAWKKSDEIRAGLGIDWKIKVPFINPKANIFISPQVYYRRIMDYKSSPGVDAWTDAQQNFVEQNNWQTSLFINTPYLNAKLIPSFFWLRDWVWNSDFFRAQVTYDWSDSWRLTGGYVWLDGNKKNFGFEPFANKDYLFMKLSYKF
jgi:hypothetical protein